MTDQRRFGWVVGLAASLLTAIAATGPAGAQDPAASARPKPLPASPDPDFETARIAFEALPEAERKGLQDALVWTGDSNGAVTGTFGRRTYEALLAYGKRRGGTGLPDAAGRAALLKAGETARNAVRFVVRPDTASGATLGIPERVLPKRTPQPGGTRWQSPDGRITVETKSLPPGETGLDATFARLTAPGPDRRVTYKLRRPDFLVVAAETAMGKSYIRYAAGAAGLRGLTIGYDKASAQTFDRLVIAIANSFVPFPEAAPAPVSAAAPATPIRVVSPVSVAPFATGLRVDARRVLTSASALEGCAAPRIGDNPARIVTRDASRDLALLETGRSGAVPSVPALRLGAPEPGGDLMVIAANAEGVTAAPGQTSADTSAGGVSAPLQPGAGGAPVLDRAGRLVGLVARFPAAPRRVAGLVPPARYDLVPAAALGAFLKETGILDEAGIANPPASVPMRAGSSAATSGATSGGRAAAALAGGVLGIACGP